MTQPTISALHTSNITSLPLLARGKVRDNYAVGDDRILMVASDRLSAFDVIMGEPIPGKGELLTQMALFWFDKLGHICPNHLTGEAPESVVTPEEVPQVKGNALHAASKHFDLYAAIDELADKLDRRVLSYKTRKLAVRNVASRHELALSIQS